MNRLSDAATVWVFGIAPKLDEHASALLLHNVDAFLDQWTAHNVPVVAGRELRDGQFLVIAAAPNSETSGCSIDKLFGLVRAIERGLGVSMLDANRVFFRGAGGAVTSATSAEFRDFANGQTVVFDTTAQRLDEIRSGRWERAARDSWHAHLLAATA